LYPKDPSDFGGEVFSDILSDGVMPLNSKQAPKMPNMFFKRLHDQLEQQQPQTAALPMLA